MSIHDAVEKAVLGKFRYLLFDVRSNGGNFGNTFYSEIDVIATGGGPTPASEIVPAKADPSKPIVAKTKNGKYEITIDASATPDLAPWCNDTLMPIMLKWYPNIVEMLPSDGFTAPTKFTVTMKPDGKNPRVDQRHERRLLGRVDTQESRRRGRGGAGA